MSGACNTTVYTDLVWIEGLLLPGFCIKVRRAPLFFRADAKRGACIMKDFDRNPLSERGLEAERRQWK